MWQRDSRDAAPPASSPTIAAVDDTAAREAVSVGPPPANMPVARDLQALLSRRAVPRSRYEQSVAVECRALTSGRYPFEAAASNDAPPGDFGRMFGYGGASDTFFLERLEPLVNTTEPRWTWRAPVTNPAPEWMLRRFETARQVRNGFLRPGSQVPDGRFRLTPSELSSDTVRLTIRIDGQSLDYAHGPQRPADFTWPGHDAGNVLHVRGER